uniref:FHA domain-containing protein n=1 Tax=Anopheles christyi TaxID=43041 RepID=A0A182KBX7_9DIPT
MIYKKDHVFVSEHVYYLVSQTACHTVGRIGTDLIITGDDSISRNHAMLQPQKDVLKLTDTGSRYGSYVNDNINKIVAISKEHPTDLKAGDKIRFGRCGSIWTVGKANFRCLTSTLVMDDQLKAVLQKIGAELLPLYTPGLTHLIMPTITVTTKFLQCLVGQIPIVSPDFFHAIERDCIVQGKSLPAVKDFVPTCTETYIRNEQLLFHPNPSRSALFRGKEFIFLNTSQHNQFENIVKLAGGVCLCAQREKIAKSRFLKPNVVTVKLKSSGSSQTQSQSFDTLSQYIASRGRRMVPDLEIGLAIMFGSTEKYCNPEYSFAFNVEECYSSAEGGETLAKNTEPQTENADMKRTDGVEMNTIPETEPLTEQKPAATTPNKPSPVGKTGNVSARSTLSALAVPKTAGPEERRKSKRMQDAEKNKQQTNNDNEDSSNLPKRPRRNPSPVESVSYSPAKDSKFTEPERNESEIQVSKTQPTPDSVLSQALQARGFRAVNHDSIETGPRVAGKEASKARRAAYLHHKLDEEDMVNFDEIASRKKLRVDNRAEKVTSTNITEVPHAGTKRGTRTRRNAPAAEQEDLFCFDDNRNNHNQSKTHPSISSDAPFSQNKVEVQNGSKGSNDSTMAGYREFIKPVQPSSMGWLSSTMCGLKLAEGVEESSFAEINIKSEPLDETDDPYGLQRDCKKWIKSMENAFPVREISMKLVAHRPIDVSGQEVSCVASDGGKNFKAFVKVKVHRI